MIFLKSKGIGLFCTGSIFPLSKVQVVCGTLKGIDGEERERREKGSGGEERDERKRKREKGRNKRIGEE